MALTDEQRSMVQLLLGGQSYDDIASLLGTSPDEVRSRARAALTEIGGADPDAQVALSDFLLGKADPIGRADAVRHLQGDPEANALATRLVSQLRLLVPGAELPDIPAPKGGRRAAPPAPSTSASAPPPSTPSVPSPATGAPTPQPQSPSAKEPLAGRVGGALSSLGGSRPRSQVIALIAGVGLLVLVGVLLITGVVGGDDSGEDGGDTATTASDENLVIVQLGPLGGADSEATGQAVFAQAEDQPLLQINLDGLPPAGQGNNYIVWLYNSDEIAFPLARDQVGENGSLTGAAPIPQEILPLLSQFGCVDVSLASNQETQQALRQAIDGQTLPGHTGESVLRGQVPIQPGQEAATGEESNCEGVPLASGAGGAGAGGGGNAGADGSGGGGAGAGSGAGAGGGTP
jgi:hypothetical protein